MKLSNEAKVGLMVAFAVVLLGVLTVKTGKIKFSSKGYEIRIQFQNVDGISVNSPVMFNGLEVGRVKEIMVVDDQAGTRMELLVWLRQDVRVRKGARAYVKNMGFMGEKYVGLTAGDAFSSQLLPDALIVGQEAADLDKVLREGQDVVKELKGITSNINGRLTKNAQAIDRIFTNLDTSMAHVADISTQINTRLKVNEENIDGIMASLRNSSGNLELLTYDLRENPWKLMYRPKGQKQKHDEELREMK